MTLECTDEEIGRLITFYELDQLGEKDRCRFEEHILECEFCFQELREMRPVVYIMREQKAQILERLAQGGVRLARQTPGALEARRSELRSRIFALIGEKFRQLAGGFGRPVVWVPAVAVAALVLLLVLPVNRHNPYLPYLDHERAPYNKVTFRGLTTPRDEARNLFDQGMEKYLQGDYAQAAEYLTRAAELAPDESAYWLYLGVSYYLDRQPKQAAEALTHALSAKDQDVRVNAEWYLAQAYLFKGEATRATPLLEEIARKGGEYASRADSLISQINRVE